jgi:NADPH-dependent 2,4-dienoyl-CoA reductase/sulfur reductase-like enzyme
MRNVEDATYIEAGIFIYIKLKALAETSKSGKPNVVIVGSSFIGMEAASTLAKQANVTVVGMEKVFLFVE